MPDGLPQQLAIGDKQKARDILAAVRTLKSIEADGRRATTDEAETLKRFGGFGAVALSMFPDPITNRFRDGWEPMGTELIDLLTPDEYASARRTTFNAFYTSPLVMRAVFSGLNRMGVPNDARVLEPGCGIGNFLGAAPDGMRFTGVELDDLSGRLAKAIHPDHDIRIENFRDTRLPSGIEAAVGNVPFADMTLDHQGQRFSLHDYFFAKTIDALAPGGIVGLVTSRYTMDKVNGAARDFLADRADLVGAIRLPDEAFKDQGTRVVTDIVFLRKRHPGEAEADPTWRQTAPVGLPDGREVAMNAYFARHPEMILGEVALDRGMYSAETLKVRAGIDYPARLQTALGALPESIFSVSRTSPTRSVSEAAVTIPGGLGEGSFFVAPDKAILQVEAGEAVPVVYGGTALKADGTMTGKRIAALIELRDDTRRVLRTQNDGAPDIEREAARRDLNHTYSRFVSTYGPINKTTISETKDGGEVRRMPNVVKFREDPDAFLVMSLEDYDDSTGKATKAPIMQKDVVGPIKPVGKVSSAEEGLLVSLNERGKVDLAHIAGLYGQNEAAILAELGDLIYHDPETDEHVTKDAYLSGNVRRKLVAAKASAEPRHARNVTALEAVQPEDLLPGEIDANLGAPWIPRDVIRDFAADLLAVEPSAITVMHLPKDAAWSVEGNWSAKSSVANCSDYGTGRIDALSLIDQALNMRSPTIYDIVKDGSGEKRVLNQTETVAAREKQKRIKQRFAGWVFDDPERAESLVRLYNDGFNNIRLREFDGSHLTFPGMASDLKLRPHQANAVWRNMADGNTLLAHVVGAGKAQPLHAKVLTPTGWSLMGHLRTGDKVIAGDGSVTEVIGVFPQGLKDVFRVTFSDGSSTECCDEHLWLTQTYGERNFACSEKRLGKDWLCAKPKVRSLSEIRATLNAPHLNAKNHSIPMTGAVQFEAQPVPLDPYTIGALLGDGSMTSRQVTITSADPEILQHMVLPPNIAFGLCAVRDNCCSWRLRKKVGHGIKRVKRNAAADALEALKLIGCDSSSKFVPEIYKYNSAEVRLAVLQGLLDTDGSADKRGHSVYFYSVSDALADDVIFLAQSLGGVARRSIKTPSFTHKGEKRAGQKCHVICLALPPDIAPFRA